MTFEDEGASYGMALSHLNANSNQIIWPYFNPIPVSMRNLNVENSTSVLPIEKQEMIQVYPNPVQQEAYISFDAAIGDKAIIQIFDVQGKIVMSTQTNSQGLVSIDTQDWAKGMYAVTLLFEGRNMSNTKFVKQ